MIKQFRALSVLVVGLAWVACPKAVFAQCELVKLIAGDAAIDDEFGTSVAISGDFAVIGAPLADDGGDKSGSVYIFKRTGTDWNQVQELTGAPGDRFGISVAIDGDTIVVGARDGDAAGDNTNTGTVSVFVNDGSGSWEQQGDPLVSETPTSGDYFGFAVAISGDVIAVGAPRHVESSNDEGAVYVFRRVGVDWSREQTLIASDAFDDDELGTSVAISGNAIIAGAPKSDPATLSRAGAAYVFRFSAVASTWVEEKKLLASDVTGNAAFGTSVSIDGDTGLVGAVQATGATSGTGALYVFRFTDSDWTQERKLTASDGVNGARFGSAVAIRGDLAVVGANRDFDPSAPTETRKGAVYFFKRDADIWVSLAKLRAGDSSPSSEYGIAVATDGTYALGGAQKDDHGGGISDDLGAAYVLVVDGGTSDGITCVTCGDVGDPPCDDGRDCTSGLCDAGLGVCTFPINAGRCLIDGECWFANDENPDNECEQCNASAPSGWVPKGEDVPCTQDDLFCNGEEQCDGAGSCVSPGDPCVLPQECDENLNRCVDCLTDLRCRDDNDCTDDKCIDGACVITDLDAGMPCGDPTDTDCDHADTCDGAGECNENIEPFLTPCTDDGDLCTNNVCREGICEPKPVDCPAGCDPDRGCICTTPADCDDGIPCTDDVCGVDDTCTNPVAAGKCLIAGVCYAAGDEDPLNNCMECDSPADQRVWTPKPAGTSCDDGDGEECTFGECDGTGLCIANDFPGGTACDDGLFCTVDDACSAGRCVGTGSPCAPELVCDDDVDACVCTADTDCDDGIPCTIDRCDSGLCDSSTIDSDKCFIDGECYDDGFQNPANECEQCNAALDAEDWSPRTGATCTDDGDPCTDNVCSNAGACIATDAPDGTSCQDNGLFCDGVETCKAGECQSPGDPCAESGFPCDESKDACLCALDSDCDDSKGCTDDACVDDLCVHTNNSKDCDDGEFCTDVDKCLGGECIGSGSPCEPGLICNEAGNTCGCTADDECDNGVFCDGVETCEKEDPSDETGECVDGVPPCLGEDLECNEDHDRCDCNDEIEGVCDDGKHCTGTESCVDGECVSSGNPCDADEPCDERNNVCQECLIGADCDDDNACTFDRCPNGVCTHTPMAGCTDSDLDGVGNDIDECPGTIAGALVDPDTGCSCDQLDDDDDGVENCVDDCADTPEDERPVTANGCSCSQLDDDEDGVSNCDDLCPESLDPNVDDVGCPPGQSGEDNENDNASDNANDNDNADDGQVWQLSLLVTPDSTGLVIPTRPIVDGEVVEIAVPDPVGEGTFEFLRWEGDIPEGQETADPLVLTMDADKTITAVFQQVGGGTGTGQNQSISRDGACGSGACGLFNSLNFAVIALTIGGQRLARRRRSLGRA